MTNCPVCGAPNLDPAEPGEVVCTNPSCGATFAWPIPVVEPPDPQSSVDDLISQMSDEELLALATTLANRLVKEAPVPRTPTITALVGNGRSHSTDATASRVKIQVVAPIGGPERARPTVNGSPVCGGAGEFVYERPGTLVIRTNAGNNDLVVTEEYD